MSGSAFQIDPARADAILEERTAALARRISESSAAAEDMLKVAVVLAAGQRYALPFHMVAAVLPAQALHALPVKDEAVIGAIHERGEIWIVYSLPAVVGAGLGAKDSGRFLLLEHSGRPAAIRVDAVEGVAAIALNTLTEIDADGPPAAGALVRHTTSNGLPVLDEEALSRRLNRPRRSAS